MNCFLLDLNDNEQSVHFSIRRQILHTSKLFGEEEEKKKMFKCFQSGHLLDLINRNSRLASCIEWQSSNIWLQHKENI